MKALTRLQMLLAKRDHSIHELHQKLSRDFPHEEIIEALNVAAENNWLVDEKTLASRFAEELSRKKKSARYIQQNLKKRGLTAPPLDEETEISKAQALLEKRFGQMSGFSFQEKQKAYNYLAYRGFSPSVIRTVINAE